MFRVKYLLPVILLGFLINILLTPRYVDAMPPNDGGGSLRFGDTRTGDLTYSETDTWIFRGQKGQRVTLSAEIYPPDPTTYFDPYLELYAPSGELLVEDDNRGVGLDALIFGYRLPENGLYSAKIRAVNPQTEGNYRFSIAADTLPEDCEAIEGEIIKVEWASEMARQTLRYRIYLPPCHQFADVRYPYIILMHGSASDDNHWDYLGIDDAILRGVALERFPPVAVVLPFGGELANTNVFRDDFSYEALILNELMPMVEENYCLWNAKAGRAIGGISRGGFWAFEIGLRHPDLFASIGGHSPFFDLYNAPDEFNPLALALSVEWSADAPRIAFDRGKFDYAQLYIDLIDERLTENDIPHTFTLYDVGAHNDFYWSAHIDDYLTFYTEPWQEGIATYPPCEKSDS